MYYKLELTMYYYCLWYDKLWGPSQRVVTLFEQGLHRGRRLLIHVMIVIRLVMKKVASIMITIWQKINDHDGHIVGQGFDQITIGHQWLVLVAIMITSIAHIIIMMPIAIHDHQDHYKSSNPDILFDIITSKWLVKKLWFDQHHHVFIIAKFLSSASLLPNVWSRGAQATTTQLSLIPAPPDQIFHQGHPDH